MLFFHGYVVLLLLAVTVSKKIDFQVDLGGIQDIERDDIAFYNAKLLNHTLNVVLQEGDTLYFGHGSFYILGGIRILHKKNISIIIEGKLQFSSNILDWPRDIRGGVLDSLIFIDCEDITISGKFDYGQPETSIQSIEHLDESNLNIYHGVIDGNGAHWWHFPFVGYLLHIENRPRMLRMIDCRNVLVENLLLVNSPYWTTLFENVTQLEVRYVEIINRRTSTNEHTVLDISAFNTDGIDVTGRDVHVHDVTIWTQDDCIAVKDGSENMLFENINASGLGLAIGSIGSSYNKNITFRNAFLYKTVKAIYVKFRRPDDESREFRCPCNYERHIGGVIEGVVFENIVIDQPEQYAVWIGPAQQVDKVDPSSCSLAWPLIPWSKCTGQKHGKVKDIVLRNISILRPTGIGVLIGTKENPIENVVFENVQVDYLCGTSSDSSFPLPDVFSQHSALIKESDGYIIRGTLLLLIGLLTTMYFVIEYWSYWIAIVAIIILYSSLLHLQLDMLQPGSYMICDHVLNGSSIKSWPIPECFIQMNVENETLGADLSCLNDFDYYHSVMGIRWLRLIPTYVVLSFISCLADC